MLSPGGKPDATAFTLAAGVACVECLRRLFGVGVELKPVNDLYIDGRKLGGILTEAIIECGRMTALITGIGINIRCAERVVSEAHAAPIALEEVLGPAVIKQLDADALASALANDVHALNQTVLRGEVEKVRWAWEQYRIREEDVMRS
jgi:BirA family biotin operon repressor/biotin-[acetyl-CoA-carboxylase] ligase